MDKLCPICNGLQGLGKQCPNCNRLLVDGGKLQNYVGPYSPYMESRIGEQCVHLLYCTDCGYDIRVAFDLFIV